jgi:F1F0 ATPase subunit 2
LDAPVVAAAWLAAGTVIGAIHFVGLHRNVRILAAGRSLLPAAAVQFGRFAVMGVALAVIAHSFGALPLLAATAGILAARTVIVRWKA